MSTTNHQSFNLTGQWSAAPYSSCTKTKKQPIVPDTEHLEWFQAEVPGSIHYDLVALGRLENPLASQKAASEAAWVCEQDWIYKTEFAVPPAWQKNRKIYIRSFDVASD